jgi:hypothetical protein
MTPKGGETIYGNPYRIVEPNSNAIPMPVRLMNNRIGVRFILRAIIKKINPNRKPPTCFEGPKIKLYAKIDCRL